MVKKIKKKKLFSKIDFFIYRYKPYRNNLII